MWNKLENVTFPKVKNLNLFPSDFLDDCDDTTLLHLEPIAIQGLIGPYPQLPLYQVSLQMKILSYLRWPPLMKSGGYKKIERRLKLYWNQEVAVTKTTDRCSSLCPALKNPT